MGGRFYLGLALTAIAGATDAVSFARFGAVYASFMSGNSVQIGLHVAAWDAAALAPFGLLVATFVVGGFTGSIFVARGGRWGLPAVLALEALAAVIGLTFDLRHGMTLASAASLSLAMGAQNNLVVLVRGANPATTFVTGTAFRFADALAQRVLGRDPAGAWKLHLCVWSAFAAGAAGGALLQVSLGAAALAPLAMLLAAFAAGAFALALRAEPIPS